MYLAPWPITGRKVASSMGGYTHVLEHVVGGGDEIGRRIDERAVEVEDEGQILHGCSACVAPQASGWRPRCH